MQRLAPVLPYIASATAIHSFSNSYALSTIAHAGRAVKRVQIYTGRRPRINPSSPPHAAMLLKTFACVLALAVPALAAPIPIHRSAVEAAMIDIERDIMPARENRISRDADTVQTPEDTIAAVIANFPDATAMTEETSDNVAPRPVPIPAKRSNEKKRAYTEVGPGIATATSSKATASSQLTGY